MLTFALIDGDALLIKLFIVAKVKNCKVHYGEVTQQCQHMTAEISVSSVFNEMTTAMLQ